MNASPEGYRVFVHRSEMPGTLQALQRFHEAPMAFERLAPPFLQLRIEQDRRRSLTEGEVVLRMGPGPLAIRWLARHEAGPTAHSFTDRLIDGPLACWVHQHIFEAQERGVALTDRITLAHRPGWRGLLTRLLFDGPALRLLFVYRHWRTRRALAEAS